MSVVREGGAPAALDAPPATPDARVLILAPRGRNAPLIAAALGTAGFGTMICADAEEMCVEIERGAGAVVLCEEAVNRARLKCLVDTLDRQPPWSEIPLLVLTGAGRTTRASFNIAQALGPGGNATLIERPLRIITLVSAVRTALRARLRQYEVRDLLAREHEARGLAEAASKAKDHFLATLSHELRTPLNPVLMTVTAMEMDPALPAAYREDVEVIRRNVELESSLIDDLLDLTRITRGKIELHQEALDLHAVVAHAMQTCCGEEARRKQLDVRFEPRAGSHHVWGDPARLAQVFWNLVKNAVKFTPAGGSITVTTRNESTPAHEHDSGRVNNDSGTTAGPPASAGRGVDGEGSDSPEVDGAGSGSAGLDGAGGDGISAGAARTDGASRWVVVEVTDTGIGIEPDAAARIFDAFEQEHRGITRRFGGLGLGLAICKALVTAHGGTITVRSRGKDTGATFAVRLAAVSEPAALAPPSGSGRDARQRRGLDILLVEDHEATASVMARLLRAMSHTVTVAGTLDAARRATADRKPFDLIVSDIGLPDGTGLDFIRHVRARRLPTPALAVSGYGTEDDIRQSHEAGFGEHLVKPVDLTKLKTAIDRVLARAN